MLAEQSLFGSFFLGGFECSTHSRADGSRLDLIASTGHDRCAEADYRLLQSVGMEACRDGLRWHLIGRTPGRFDFSSAMSQIRASRRTGMQVIWDVLHYGWPGWVDVFDADFPTQFGRFARAAARVIASETPGPYWFCVVNEPSFLCWAGAQEGLFPPFVKGRGDDLKKQLIRATVEGIEAIRDVVPGARFMQVDPLIHIVPDFGAPDRLRDEAAGYREAQFQCTDILVGRRFPEIGGNPKYLDVIGCNYYVHNQWVYKGGFMDRTDPRYRPLWRMLQEVWERYERPLVIAETGIEDERRPEWLTYIGNEVEIALRTGIPVEGVCLYPVVNHPGWDDDRHCHNGLWDYCDADGHREIHSPMASELRIQQNRFRNVRGFSGRNRESVQVYA